MNEINKIEDQNIENSIERIRIKDQEQIDVLAEVFESLIGKQEYFFQHQQRIALKEILSTNSKEGITVQEVLQKIVSSDNEYLSAFKVIANEYLKMRHGAYMFTILFLICEMFSLVRASMTQQNLT
ncbi:hypothetical protein [Calidifontibacillus erzurumensis]|uniref:hypothetical protein n=1 Tax=Calidifontibacillus erzurumensis TaxID=2741433 RepID=UPI0035B55001